jgi:ubiquinone/menaquinone biosynthesis C-methylase UbiE
MPTTLIPIPSWLATLPQEDGFYHISGPRRFAHDEDKYDEQYNNQPNLTVGKGVLAAALGSDTSAPALEVGCGTGLVSLGLAAHSPYPLTILTDPSPAFLRITRRKMEAAGISLDRAAFAVLMGEELDRLPERGLSLIVLRSTLHHVLHVDQFIASAARALRPGGVLTFQEPCMEGYLLMGALVQFLPVLAERSGSPVTDAQVADVTKFADTMKFYARRDLDKSTAEDKHLFRVDELMKLGERAGLSVEFLPNTTYDALAESRENPGRDTFAHFFRQYARYCMSWDEALMDRFVQLLEPHAKYLDEAAAGSTGPYLHGVFVCRKV